VLVTASDAHLVRWAPRSSVLMFFQVLCHQFPLPLHSSAACPVCQHFGHVVMFLRFRRARSIPVGPVSSWQFLVVWAVLPHALHRCFCL
jgi:hypothetical protein